MNEARQNFLTLLTMSVNFYRGFTDALYQGGDAELKAKFAEAKDDLRDSIVSVSKCWNYTFSVKELIYLRDHTPKFDSSLIPWEGLCKILTGKVVEFESHIAQHYKIELLNNLITNVYACLSVLTQADVTKTVPGINLFTLSPQA